MRRVRIAILTVCVIVVGSTGAYGQTSSLGARKRAADQLKPPPTTPRETVLRRRNAVYERYSWVTVAPTPLKKFKVHDLITIVVRQRSNYEADSELDTQKKWNLKSELEAFLKGTAGGIGAAAFRRGKPTIDYKFSSKLQGKGDLEREDRFTTRLTAAIIDVKPNGNLVIQGRGALQFDDEVSVVTVTGVCRKADITPDNTILSTQMAELNVTVNNTGALRRASSRGWIPRLLDWLKPI